MRVTTQAILLLIGLGVFDCTLLVDAKKPPRAPSGRRSSTTSAGPSRAAGRSPRRSAVVEEENDDDFDFPLDPDDGDDEFDEEDDYRPRRKESPPHAKRGPPPKRSGSASRERSSFSNRYEEDVEEDNGRPRRPPGGRNPSRQGPPPRRGHGGRVIPYGREPTPSAFTKGLAALKNSIPDPAAVREAAANSLSVAREATSGLSANLYREVKGLTSSELEQVMLKATRPDDTAVKGKHVERLVGVTYQISARYDIYDAVLRKLWAKMAEKDWRTTIKALYILHRFSADGAPDHAPSLKVRVRRFAGALQQQISILPFGTI
jgi:ANTH domain